MFQYIVGVNAIVIVAGANMKLSVDDIKNAEEVISKAKVVLCQLEIDQNVTLAAIQLAKQYNGWYNVVVNPNKTQGVKLTPGLLYAE